MGLVCLIFDQHVVGFLVTILAILGSVIFGNYVQLYSSSTDGVFIG